MPELPDSDISLVLLAVAILARYARHLAGHWRLIYVVSAMTALYLNVFVLIVQLFQKVPALKALAPAVRAAIRGHATGRARAVCLANHFRCDQVSRRTTKEGLTLTINSND